jgi:hypothetical protein
MNEWMRNHDRQENSLKFVGQLVNKLRAFMEPEGLLPCPIYPGRIVELVQ